MVVVAYTNPIIPNYSVLVAVIYLNSQLNECNSRLGYVS